MAGIQNKHSLERARRSRDARFDGLFFTGVRTTGIYCRPICPATPPLEKNVEYYATAVQASAAGFRPCLRCRPDAAPHSNAWLGTQTTFQRALKLINEGALHRGSLPDLATRLGISDRYLRELFYQNLGTSPNNYAIYQRCLFAKQLLHESTLSVTDIAFAAGFNSVRRFNEAMQQHVGLAPRAIRAAKCGVHGDLTLSLHYRPPFDWAHTWQFLSRRIIEGLEWITEDSYSRTISYENTQGAFTIRHLEDKTCLLLQLQLDDYRHLNAITQRIRTLFDVDAPIAEIDAHLSRSLAASLDYQPGLRIPGIWSSFEAGIRAILGQQVSVAQALQLVTTLVQELGDDLELEHHGQRKLFPTPAELLRSELTFLKMPQSRKDTLHRLAEHFLNCSQPDDINAWLKLKGIGPWTANYVKIRSARDPDVWLAGDAGVKNALIAIDHTVPIEDCKPWRSYLTFQLWQQLAMRRTT